mgnify:CR=1 FL=1
MGDSRSRDTAIPAVEIERFDFSTLVGHRIVLFAEQFPGKPLASRVTVASGKFISIDRSGGDGLIDSLVNNQRVVLKIDYKGQPVSVAATLKRNESGGCRILLGETVTPLLRRRFVRVPITCPFRFAAIPSSRFSDASLARLRWLETETLSLSGGGTMIRFSSLIEPPTYLFANVARADFGFPALVLGQVRSSFAPETGRWHIGIQFIPRELRREHLPLPTIRQMPASVFALDAALQSAIEEKLIAFLHDNTPL